MNHSVKKAWIWVWLLTVSAAPATIVATSIIRYDSFDDSPYKEAVTAGNNLIYPVEPSTGLPRFNPNVGTLPDGYGVRDGTAWDYLWLTKANVLPSRNWELGIESTVMVLPSQFGPVDFTFTFAPTSDGKYPHWFGFAQASRYESEGFVGVLGVNGESTWVVLTELNNATKQDLYSRYFQGFTVDYEIKSLVFCGPLSIADFQYGYGAGPIPEPCSLLLVGLGGVVLRRRRGL